MHLIWLFSAPVWSRQVKESMLFLMHAARCQQESDESELIAGQTAIDVNKALCIKRCRELSSGRILHFFTLAAESKSTTRKLRISTPCERICAPPNMSHSLFHLHARFLIFHFAHCDNSRETLVFSLCKKWIRVYMGAGVVLLCARRKEL